MILVGHGRSSWPSDAGKLTRFAIYTIYADLIAGCMYRRAVRKADPADEDATFSIASIIIGIAWIGYTKKVMIMLLTDPSAISAAFFLTLGLEILLRTTAGPRDRLYTWLSCGWNDPIRTGEVPP